MATYVQRASDSIAGFRQRYEKFSRLLQVNQYAKGTIDNYCSKIACVCLFYGKVPEDLSKDEIDLYLSGLLGRKPLPASSLFVHVSVGFRCYYSLMGFPQLKFNLPRIKRKRILPVVLSEQEMRSLLQQTSDYRQKAILTLIYSLGIRVGELCKLSVSDVDTDRMLVHIRQGKGNKDRYVPLAKISLPLLRRYIRDYRPSQSLFYGKAPGIPLASGDVSAILKEACIRIGCRKRVTCHTLRHTYACHSLEMGVSILRVKELLGHCNLNTTLVYLQVIRNDNEVLSNPLDQLFPQYKP